MPAPLHLVVAFSDHGYGHIAQCAPVVNALRERLAALPEAPTVRLTLLSGAPDAFLRGRVQGPFAAIHRATGVSLVMEDAMRVSAAASLEAYRALHGPRPEDWAARVQEEASFLARLPGGPPDLLLSDVPYLPLAAAARLGVPGVALCSFDWEVMFGHYCLGQRVADQPGDLRLGLGAAQHTGDLRLGLGAAQRTGDLRLGLGAAQHTGDLCLGLGAAQRTDDLRLGLGAAQHTGDSLLDLRIAREIRAAYLTARLFLRPAPSMPDPDWLLAAAPADPSTPGHPPARLMPIGPSCMAGRSRRAELESHLPELATARLLLIVFGGIATPVDLSAWPSVPPWRFIVPTDEEASRHPDALPLSTLLRHLPFEDLLASADALLCKPGYGTFVEAAVGSVPVLYIPRGDWPEEPCLTAFLHAHTRALAVPASILSGRAGAGDSASYMLPLGTGVARANGSSVPHAPIGAGIADALGVLLAQPPRPPAALTGPPEAASILIELLGLGASGARPRA